MRMGRVCFHAFLLILVAGLVSPLLAQEQSRQEILLRKRREKAKELSPYEISSGEARVLWLEETHLPEKIFVRGWHGLRPIIGGAPQGAGPLVGGVGYTHGLDSEAFQLSVNGRTSTNRYQILDARADFPTALSGSRLRFSVDGSYRALKRFIFFGLGNDSEHERTYYRLKDAWAGGSVTYQASRRLELGAQGKWLSARTDGSSKSPAVDSVFLGDDSPPGFNVPRTDYGVYGGNVVFNLKDRGLPAAGAELRLEATRYEDIDNQFDFTELSGEATAYLPLGYRNRILAARLWTAHRMADRGQDVPFYLMDPIGGSRTLRGFEGNRFRDLRDLVFNLEYRWEVWTYTDFAFLYDAGKVFSSADDLDFSDLHHGYGFGVRVHSPVGGVLRWDITNSDEGLRMYLWMGTATFFNE